MGGDVQGTVVHHVFVVYNNFYQDFGYHLVGEEKENRVGPIVLSFSFEQLKNVLRVVRKWESTKFFVSINMNVR